MVKDIHFGQKSRPWTNIDILVTNRNFGQKSKSWSNNELLAKKHNFIQTLTCCSKIKILAIYPKSRSNNFRDIRLNILTSVISHSMTTTIAWNDSLLDTSSGHGAEMAAMAEEDLLRVHQKAFVTVAVRFFFVFLV